MQLTAFLTDTLGLPEGETVRAMRALGGKELRNLAIVRTLKEAKQLIGRATPIHVLPIGRDGSLTVGLHLRPADIGAGEPRVVHWLYPDGIMDQGTLRELVSRMLVDLEGDALEAGEDAAPRRHYTLVDEAFGEGAFTSERQHELMLHDPREGPAQPPTSGQDYSDVASMAMLDPDKLIEIYDKGRKALPDLMFLHGGVVRNAMQTFEFARGAQAFADSLQCYHHTVFQDIRKHFERGTRLLAMAPEAFDDAARAELEVFDNDEATGRRARELGTAGDAALLAKMLNDKSHFFQDYVAPLAELRGLYEHLAWEWAMALCDLRR